MFSFDFLQPQNFTNGFVLGVSALHPLYVAALLITIIQWIVRINRFHAKLAADAIAAGEPLPEDVTRRPGNRPLYVFYALTVLAVVINAYNAVNMRLTLYQAWAVKHSFYDVPNHMFTGWSKPTMGRIAVGKAAYWELYRWYAMTNLGYEAEAMAFSNQRILWWQANSAMGLIALVISIGLKLKQIKRVPSYLGVVLVLLAQATGTSIACALFLIVVLIAPRYPRANWGEGADAMFSTIHPNILWFFAAIAQGLVLFTEFWSKYPEWWLLAILSWFGMPLFLCWLTQNLRLHRFLRHFTYNRPGAHYAGMYARLSLGFMTIFWYRASSMLREYPTPPTLKVFDFIFGSHAVASEKSTLSSEIGSTISKIIGTLGSDVVARYIAWDVALTFLMLFAWAARRHLQPSGLLFYAGLWPGHNPIRTGVQTTMDYARVAYNVVQSRVPILPGPLAAEVIGGADSDSDEELITEEDMVAKAEKEGIEAAKSGTTERLLRSARKPLAPAPTPLKKPKAKATPEAKPKAKTVDPETPSKKGRAKAKASPGKKRKKMVPLYEEYDEDGAIVKDDEVEEVVEEAKALEEAEPLAELVHVAEEENDEAEGAGKAVAQPEKTKTKSKKESKGSVRKTSERPAGAPPRATDMIDPDETELETAAVSWVLMILGGLGMATCAVLGAELESGY